MLTSAEWEELRRLARIGVERDRRRFDPGVRLSGIDTEALRACESWLGPNRRADWDWRALTKRVKDARFEVAIWHRTELCGLAFGPVDGTIGLGRAALEYIEAAPRPHSMTGQIIPLSLLALEEFGRIMEVPEVRLLGALSHLVPIYVRYGYEVVEIRPGISYLRKRMAVP